MKKIKWAKWITTSALVIAPTALVVGFATDWSHKTVIMAVGSSGVKPFVEYFSDNYNTPGIDVTVEAGGSGLGITEIAEGHSSIGNSSKDPYTTVTTDEHIKQEWTDRNIKTITIAWEAICIIYIPPKNLTSEQIEDMESYMAVSQDNIENFYSIFTGYYGTHGVTPTFGDLCGIDKTDSAHSAWANTPITPYVRSGGSDTSGTAGAFHENSGFDTSKVDPKVEEALKHGTYGDNYTLYDTAESNTETWRAFYNNHIVGSMVYLSSNFVETNKQLIEEAGYQIMGYVPEEGTTEIKPYEVENVTKGYNWYRPINCMIDIPEEAATDTTKWTPAMKFIASMFFGDNLYNSNGTTKDLDDPKLQWGEAYKNMQTKTGGIPLTTDQFKSMINSASEMSWENFWNGDMKFNGATAFGAHPTK